MTSITVEPNTRGQEETEPDPFDLDIRVIEFGGRAANLLELTDDGCGSTCPRACVTNPG